MEIFEDSNDVLLYFESSVLNVVNDHAPIIKKKVKINPSPWLTPEIRSKMMKRDSLLRKSKKNKDSLLWNQYQELRNEINIEIRKNKHKSIQEKFKASSQSSNIWKIKKELCGDSHKKGLGIEL